MTPKRNSPTRHQPQPRQATAGRARRRAEHRGQCRADLPAGPSRRRGSRGRRRSGSEELQRLLRARGSGRPRWTRLPGARVARDRPQRLADDARSDRPAVRASSIRRIRTCCSGAARSPPNGSRSRRASCACACTWRTAASSSSRARSTSRTSRSSRRPARRPCARRSPIRATSLLARPVRKVELLDLKRDGAILVPQRAVQQGLTGAYVYVVGDSNKVGIRPVQASSWSGSQWIVDNGHQTRRQSHRRWDAEDLSRAPRSNRSPYNAAADTARCDPWPGRACSARDSRSSRGAMTAPYPR